MLAVADMQKTISFYENVLGFRATMTSTEYSIIERDGQTIHLMKAASEHVMECVRGHAEIYVEVSDIHALWEHVKTFKDQPYGMTEFQIGDPNDCLVFVGDRNLRRSRSIIPKANF